ncbi:hypothetical protein [Streptomyces sp. NPDC013187]|uniref:hypothetical protein n=1 Tax=Streptomyces sp. NPDC013187 TaxID=3364865 RepID=UPI0036AD2D0B
MDFQAALVLSASQFLEAGLPQGVMRELIGHPVLSRTEFHTVPESAQALGHPRTEIATLPEGIPRRFGTPCGEAGEDFPEEFLPRAEAVTEPDSDCTGLDTPWRDAEQFPLQARE